MEQADLLRYVLDVLEEVGIPYMVVGSFASGAYGEPRLTLDIDIVIEIHRSQIDNLCKAFPAGEFYVSREAAVEAVQQEGQFNVLHPSSGNKIDFMIAKQDPWGREQLSRRQKVQILPSRKIPLSAR